MPDSIDWLILGDFNLYRHPDDRNKPRAYINEMYMFNEAINKLGLIELQLRGKRFTWTNKQHPPLLERLDWVLPLLVGPCPTLLLKSQLSPWKLQTMFPASYTSLPPFPMFPFFDLKTFGCCMIISLIRFIIAGLFPPITLIQLRP